MYRPMVLTERRKTFSTSEKTEVVYRLKIFAQTSHVILATIKKYKKFKENISMEAERATIKNNTKEKLIIMRSISKVINFKMIVVLISKFFIR